MDEGKYDTIYTTETKEHSLNTLNLVHQQTMTLESGDGDYIDEENVE